MILTEKNAREKCCKPKMNKDDSLIESIPRRGQSRQREEDDNMLMYIILAVIGLVILAILIWCLCMRTKKDTSPPLPDEDIGTCDCPCEIGTPVLTCCKLSCPSHAYVIDWANVPEATAYDVVIDIYDVANDTSEQISTQVTPSSYLLQLDPAAFSEQLDLTISVTALNVPCNITGTPGVIFKPAVSARPGGWSFNEGYVGALGGSDLSDGPLIPTAAPAPLPAAVGARETHMFTGPAGVPYGVQMSLGSNGDDSDGQCTLRIEEIPRASFDSGDYTAATLLYEAATPAFSTGATSHLVNATVTPTLENSLWVYSCDSDLVGPPGVDARLESLRVNELSI